VLATAGDDGNVLLWVPAENQTNTHNFEEGLEDKESWRVKTMCRSIGVYFITGSMDNVARIYNAQTGTTRALNIRGRLLNITRRDCTADRRA
jgi:chromatin assembly factor 1 subunit B